MNASQIDQILNEARPMLLRHGGNIEVVEVDEKSGLVKLRLQGTCVGCPMSQFTMRLGIEKLLRERIPEIKKVIDLTELEAGFTEEE